MAMNQGQNNSLLNIYRHSSVQRQQVNNNLQKVIFNIMDK